MQMTEKIETYVRYELHEQAENGIWFRRGSKRLDSGLTEAAAIELLKIEYRERVKTLHAGDKTLAWLNPDFVAPYAKAIRIVRCNCTVLEIIAKS